MQATFSGGVPGGRSRYSSSSLLYSWGHKVLSKIVFVIFLLYIRLLETIVLIIRSSLGDV